MLGAGATLRAEIDETDGYFPPDNPFFKALEEIDELFGETGEVIVISLLFRGEALIHEMASCQALCGFSGDKCDNVAQLHGSCNPSRLTGPAHQP